MLAFAAIVMVVVVSIPAYGYYQTFVAPPRRTVLEINGVKHSLGEITKLAKANIAATVDAGGEPDMTILPYEMRDGVMYAEIIRQAAPELGLSVTQGEIDQRLRELYYPRPAAGEQTDPDAMDREFQERYRQYLNVTQFSDAEYREIVKGDLLRAQIAELMSERVPTVGEQVFVHWLRITGEDVLEQVQQRLEDGDELDKLFRIYVRGDAFADDDGEVGWIPRGAFPDMDDVLFTVEHDIISEPIRTGRGIYLVKVTDGPELRDINEKMRDVLKTRALQDWLVEEIRNSEVSGTFGLAEYEWVVRKSLESVPSTSS